LTAPPDFSQSSTPYSLLVPSHPPHALSSLATLFPPSARDPHRRTPSPESLRGRAFARNRPLTSDENESQLPTDAPPLSRQHAGLISFLYLRLVLENHSSSTSVSPPASLTACRRETSLLDATSCPPSCQRSLLGLLSIGSHRLSLQPDRPGP
jgi:hypothetical protein